MEKELWSRVQNILQERNKRQIEEGALRALGMGIGMAAGGAAAAAYKGMNPAVGAALGAAWYIAGGDMKKDLNYDKEKEEKEQEEKERAEKKKKQKKEADDKSPWPVVPFKPSFA